MKRQMAKSPFLEDQTTIANTPNKSLFRERFKRLLHTPTVSKPSPLQPSQNGLTNKQHEQQVIPRQFTKKNELDREEFETPMFELISTDDGVVEILPAKKVRFTSESPPEPAGKTRPQSEKRLLELNSQNTTQAKASTRHILPLHLRQRSFYRSQPTSSRQRINNATNLSRISSMEELRKVVSAQSTAPTSQASSQARSARNSARQFYVQQSDSFRKFAFSKDECEGASLRIASTSSRYRFSSSDVNSTKTLNSDSKDAKLSKIVSELFDDSLPICDKLNRCRFCGFFVHWEQSRCDCCRQPLPSRESSRREFTSSSDFNAEEPLPSSGAIQSGSFKFSSSCEPHKPPNSPRPENKKSLKTKKLRISRFSTRYSQRNSFLSQAMTRVSVTLKRRKRILSRSNSKLSGSSLNTSRNSSRTSNLPLPPSTPATPIKLPAASSLFGSKVTPTANSTQNSTSLFGGFSSKLSEENKETSPSLFNKENQTNAFTFGGAASLFEATTESQKTSLAFSTDIAAPTGPPSNISATQPPKMSVFGSKTDSEPAKSLPTFSFGTKPVEPSSGFTFGSKTESTSLFGSKIDAVPKKEAPGDRDSATKPTGAFSFGVAAAQKTSQPEETPKLSNVFGTSALATAPSKPQSEAPKLFNFGSTPKTVDGVGGGADKPPAISFNFGQAAKIEEKPPGSESGFNFGAPKLSGNSSEFVFGSKPTQEEKPAPAAGFTFSGAAAAQPQTSGLAFNFGAASQTATKGNQTAEFKFAAPSAPSAPSSGFNFSNSVPTSSFSFGAAASQTPTVGTGGWTTFGKKEPSNPTSAAPSSGGFMFDSKPPMAASNTSAPAPVNPFAFMANLSQNKPQVEAPNSGFTFGSAAPSLATPHNPSFGALSSNIPKITFPNSAAAGPTSLEPSTTFNFGANSFPQAPTQAQQPQQLNSQQGILPTPNTAPNPDVGTRKVIRARRRHV